MVGGTVEMWHVHNVIPEQQEHVVERVGAEASLYVSLKISYMCLNVVEHEKEQGA